MTLKLYNTRTRRKEDFQPLDPNNVRMYVCGPTVYDYAHIGNARPVIVFDVLYRLLRHLYGESHVTYVRNITDVDDKINARAAERYPELPFNDAIRKLTDETAAQYQRDVAALGCLPPTHEPRATEYIVQMREMIETLVDKGFAYVAEDHALFNVSAMPDYGQLARRSLDEMRAGARVEVAPYKRDPMDFVLWKPSKEGEPSWPSPRGIAAPGRPGWHLECSAMAKALLGETFDIHGGGIDLVFPHHENEVAQSRCAHGTDIMANVWMHNGFLQVEGQKMSKSLGNFFTIDELLQDWPGDVLRFHMLKTHYRQPINWTDHGLEESAQELSQWAFIILYAQKEDGIDISRWKNENIDSELESALLDDLNGPLAITRLRKLFEMTVNDSSCAIKLIANAAFLDILNPSKLSIYDRGIVALNVTPEVKLDLRPLVLKWRAALSNGSDRLADDLFAKMSLLAYVGSYDKSGYIKFNGVQGTESYSPIQGLIDARNEARAAKKWAEADRIRDELAGMGIALKDAKNPETGEIVTTWEIAR